MKTALKFTAGIVLMCLIGWIVFQIGSLLSAVESSRSDRAELRNDLEQDQQVIAAQQEKLEELQRRCSNAEDCTPLSPEVIRESGTPGANGLDGASGARGPQGFPGMDGKDGATGQQGSVGATGATGATGEPGATGADGQDGAQGDPGPTGPKGDTGPAGPTGPAGTAQPGTYACPDGQVLTGFTVAADGAVAITCATPIIPPGPDPTTGG